MTRARAFKRSVVVVALMCAACSDPETPEPGDVADAATDATPDTVVDTAAPDAPTPDGGDVASDAGDTAVSDTDATGADGDADTGAPTYSVPTIWRLERGADKWTEFDSGDRESRFAPRQEVLAAFDIEHSNTAFVLTAKALYKLHLDNDRQGESDPVWVDRRPLDGVAGGALAEAELWAATSDPEMSPDDAVAVVGKKGDSPSIWRGTYDFDNDTLGELSAEPAEWSSDAAPAPADIVAAWRDNANARKWFDGEPPCGVSPTDEFRAYVGYLTSTHLHLHDVWYCTEYFRARKLAEAGVSVEGRPAIETIGAAFWHNRELYLVAR